MRVLPLLSPLLAAFLLLASGPARAEEMTAERMQAFADFLFEQGDYYRAITEYERMVFFHPDHPLADSARFRIAESYLKGDKLDTAIGRLRTLATDRAGREVGIRSKFLLGEAFDRKRQYKLAAEAWAGFLDSYPADARADEARVRLGFSTLRQGDWARAEAEFAKVPEGSPLGPRAGELAREVRGYPEVPKKSPTLAGILSGVLPGAGQVYIGKTNDALTAFLLNAAFILAIVEAHENDDHTTAGILLFFETGWYSGNIYNAVNGAQKLNRRAEQDFIDRLKPPQGISLSTDGRGGSLLAFSLSY